MLTAAGEYDAAVWEYIHFLAESGESPKAQPPSEDEAPYHWRQLVAPLRGNSERTCAAQQKVSVAVSMLSAELAEKLKQLLDMERSGVLPRSAVTCKCPIEALVQRFKHHSSSSNSALPHTYEYYVSEAFSSLVQYGRCSEDTFTLGLKYFHWYLRALSDVTSCPLCTANAPAERGGLELASRMGSCELRMDVALQECVGLANVFMDGALSHEEQHRQYNNEPYDDETAIRIIHREHIQKLLRFYMVYPTPLSYIHLLSDTKFGLSSFFPDFVSAAHYALQAMLPNPEFTETRPCAAAAALMAMVLSEGKRECLEGPAPLPRSCTMLIDKVLEYARQPTSTTSSSCERQNSVSP